MSWHPLYANGVLANVGSMLAQCTSFLGHWANVDSMYACELGVEATFHKMEAASLVRLWRCCLLSVPLGEQASGRRWDCSGLGHPATWPGDRRTRVGGTGNEDNNSFAGFFFNLTNMICSVLP